MGKIRSWIKEKLCIHYYEVHNGKPLFIMHPKKTLFTPGLFSIKYANYKGLIDPEAKKCLNCGVYFFETNGRGIPL